MTQYILRISDSCKNSETVLSLLEKYPHIKEKLYISNGFDNNPKIYTVIAYIHDKESMIEYDAVDWVIKEIINHHINESLEPLKKEYEWSFTWIPYLSKIINKLIENINKNLGNKKISPDNIMEWAYQE